MSVQKYTVGTSQWDNKDCIKDIQLHFTFKNVSDMASLESILEIQAIWLCRWWHVLCFTPVNATELLGWDKRKTKRETSNWNPFEVKVIVHSKIILKYYIFLNIIFTSYFVLDNILLYLIFFYIYIISWRIFWLLLSIQWKSLGSKNTNCFKISSFVLHRKNVIQVWRYQCYFSFKYLYIFWIWIKFH